MMKKSFKFLCAAAILAAAVSCASIEKMAQMADLVGSFLGLQLFLQILHIGLLDITLRRQFDDVVDQAFLSAISDEKAENRHHNDGYDGYNQVNFHIATISKWQRYDF